MEELKQALKELFKSGAIDIRVKESYSEWEGKCHEVSVIIDGETVYKDSY
jgi:di/tripeptidase